MQIIDASYFQGEIKIAQLSQLPVKENLDWFINRYEGEILDKILGYSLAARFKAGLAEDPISPEWEALLNGTLYDVDGKTRSWMGFRNSRKASLVANYVYFFYMRNEVTQTVGIGTVSPFGENSERQSPAPKMVRAWNEMLDYIEELYYFLKAYPVYEFSAANTGLKGLRDINAFNL